MDEAAVGSAAQAVSGMSIKAAKVMTCVDELRLRSDSAPMRPVKCLLHPVDL